MKALRLVSVILMIIGSLNWGLIGLFQFDLVGGIFGGMTAPLARIVFTIVGLAGVYGIYLFCKCSKSCNCGPNCGCGCKK